jgi:MFS transporter, DHA2 family, methylenomycin A resistance protein
MSASRQRWTLIAACSAQFMILLDVTIVNVALPSIQRELEVTAGNLVWTINAYVLPLASLILVGGTLGDRYGRKRVFALGFVLFTAFSAGCALSTSDGLLIAFRALQGAGAALLAPLSLSILVDAFGLGPVLGGALIEVFDWSAIFWVNVPIGFAGLLTTLSRVRESRDPNARRLDLGGAALISSALFCLTFGLVETDDHAWTSAFTLAFLGAAAALGAAFVAFEAWHREPMLPLEFFRRRAFTVANLSYFLLYAALAGTLFFVSLYFQNVKGFSALETGLSWLTMNVPFLLVSPFAGRLQAWLGARRVVVIGALLAGLGVLVFALLDVDTPFLVAVPGYVFVGVGYGSAVPAISAVAMGAIEVERAGVASGILNTARQVGAAVGLAALGSIATAVASGSFRNPEDFVSGMRAAMLVGGALALTASLLTWRAGRS